MYSVVNFFCFFTTEITEIYTEGTERVKRGLYLGAVVLFLGQSAPAQLLQQEHPQKTIIGVWGDALYNNHQTNFNFFPAIDACGKFTHGDGIRGSFGLFSDIPLKNTFEIHTSLGYQNLSGNLKAVPVDTFRRAVSGNGQRIDREHQLASSITALSAQALLTWHSPINILFSAGPQLSFFPKTPTYLQTERIISPDNVVYDHNGEPIDTLGEGNIPNASSFLASLALRASYRIRVNDRFVAVPEASVAVPLNKISSSLSWNISSYSLGVGIGYEVGDRHVGAHLLDGLQLASLPPTQPKRMPLLNASLIVNGLDEQGNIVPAPAIFLGKTIIDEEIALVPAVFFDSASNTIPSRYRSRNETDIVIGNSDSLGTINALDVAHDILNIVGKRMQEHREAKLRLSGASGTMGSESHNLALARRRAEAVKEYLVSAWSIDPARIETSGAELPKKPSNVATQYGREENRRVDISSDEYEIVKPYHAQSVVKRYVSPPGLLLEPSYFADTTISSWAITIKTQTASLEHFGSEDISDLLGTRKRWKIDPNKIGERDDSVHVELAIEDAVGQHVQTIASLPVYRTWQESSKHYSTTFENIEIERFNVITFDFDKGGLPQAEERRLENARKSVSPDASVRIAGYADAVTGDAAYNKKLSGDRAKTIGDLIVKGALQQYSASPKDVAIEAIGAKDLYDNLLPEGRFLSRTVRIEIVKPLK